MSAYRPRPHDHLVEPLFGGLAGAHSPTGEAPPAAAPRGIGHASVLLALAVAALAVAGWWLL